MRLCPSGTCHSHADCCLGGLVGVSGRKGHFCAFQDLSLQLLLYYGRSIVFLYFKNMSSFEGFTFGPPLAALSSGSNLLPRTS